VPSSPTTTPHVEINDTARRAAYLTLPVHATTYAWDALITWDRDANRRKGLTGGRATGADIRTRVLLLRLHRCVQDDPTAPQWTFPLAVVPARGDDSRPTVHIITAIRDADRIVVDV
jgi:hypothetical protein